MSLSRVMVLWLLAALVAGAAEPVPGVRVAVLEADALMPVLAVASEADQELRLPALRIAVGTAAPESSGFAEHPRASVPPRAQVTVLTLPEMRLAPGQLVLQELILPPMKSTTAVFVLECNGRRFDLEKRWSSILAVGDQASRQRLQKIFTGRPGAGPTVFGCRVQDLPVAAANLPFYRVFLGLQAARELTPGQWARLDAAVCRGMHLRILDDAPAGDGDDLKALDPAFAALLPVRLGAKTQPLQPAVLEAIGGWPFPAALTGLCVREAEAKSGAQPFRALLPVTVAPRGTGTVTYVGFDLLAPQLTAWRGFGPALGWLQDNASHVTRRDLQRDVSLRGPTPPLDVTLWWATWMQPAAGGMLLLLMAQAGILFLLYRRYQRGAQWSRRGFLARLWLLALVICILLAVLQRAVRNGSVSYRGTELLALYPEAGVCRLQAHLRLFSRAPQRLPCVWPSAPDAAATGEDAWAETRRRLPVMPAHDSAAEAQSVLELAGFEWRQVMAWRQAAKDWRLEGDIRLAADGTVSGRVRNHTPLPLQQCQLLVPVFLPGTSTPVTAGWLLLNGTLQPGGEWSFNANLPPTTEEAGQSSSEDTATRVAHVLRQVYRSNVKNLSTPQCLFLATYAQPQLLPQLPAAVADREETCILTQELACTLESQPPLPMRFGGGTFWSYHADGREVVRPGWNSVGYTLPGGAMASGFLILADYRVLLPGLHAGSSTPGYFAFKGFWHQPEPAKHAAAAAPRPVSTGAQVAVGEVFDWQAAAWTEVWRDEFGGTAGLDKLSDAELQARLRSAWGRALERGTGNAVLPPVDAPGAGLFGSGMFGGLGGQTSTVPRRQVELPDIRRFATQPAQDVAFRVRCSPGPMAYTFSDVTLSNQPPAAEEKEKGNEAVPEFFR